MAEGGSGHNTRAVIAALLANLGIAVAKFAGFVLTGASSMLAESFHSVADSGNQTMLLAGGRVARRGPDRRHPFGHGRVRYFAAFLVAVVLFTLGSLFSFYEGYQKLRHPHELESVVIALAILVIALVFEGLSLRTAVREATPLRGNQGWWSFIRTTKKPELAVVLLEDTAAELGLLFAFAGVGLAAVTHDPVWDAFGTLAIGALLAVVAVVLGIEMYSLLLGEAASPSEQEVIRQAILGTDRVARVVQLRTMHLGPEEVLVVGGLELDPDLSADDAARVIDQAQARVREALPSARVIYLEPDLPTAVPESR
ncbi:MAG TPA: cation diffusion facilitator family transporter [Actinomycetota bacterium]|jgi:cation diffusion facilitator family transporter|nr:cation diffusion facilitator family transporter [Actinomycetota bacterium]